MDRRPNCSYCWSLSNEEVTAVQGLFCQVIRTAGSVGQVALAALAVFGLVRYWFFLLTGDQCTVYEIGSCCPFPQKNWLAAFHLVFVNIFKMFFFIYYFNFYVGYNCI